MGWVTDEKGLKMWAVVYSDGDREELYAAELKECVARGRAQGDDLVANAAKQACECDVGRVCCSNAHAHSLTRTHNTNTCV